MTHAMVKGSNVQLKTVAVRAVLCWSPGSGVPDVDASAVLLDDGGQVRSDEDFIFYNQPQHPAGVVRHLGKTQDSEGLRDAIETDLPGLGSHVDRVLLAASADGGTFADVRSLRLLLYGSADEADEPLLSFEIEPETGAETALICGELYRRGSGWKFRALGQGYDTGLIGLATEFGITVEEPGSGEQKAAVGDAKAPKPKAKAKPDTQPDRQPDARPDTQPKTQPSTQPAATVPPPPSHPPTTEDATVPAMMTTQPYIPDPDDDFPLVPPAPTAPPQPSPMAATGPGPAAPTAAQPGYGYPQPGYPQPPQQPPATQPAYGYPQPAYGYPQPDPDFALPPQGPQFQTR
jgi:stress response protein SCP2